MHWNKKDLLIAVIALAAVLMVAACGGQEAAAVATPEPVNVEVPVTVEVTREVVEVQEVEVTRQVEVEVTRIVSVEVEVTPAVLQLPADFFVGDVWYGGQAAYMRDGKVFRFDAETRTIVDEGEWRHEGNIRTVTITAGECQGATIRYETTQVLGINEIWHVVVSNTCDSGWGTPSGRALQHGRSPLKDWQRELLVARGYNADFL